MSTNSSIRWSSKLSYSTQPPYPLNCKGEPRRVGVELELSGLDLNQLSALVKKALGGEVVFHSPYEAEVRDTALGAVRIEFDTLLFREMRVRDFFAELKTELIDPRNLESLEALLASVAAWLVPYEIVFPPVTIERLELLDQLRRKLALHAQGTGTSVLNAFGLHLNVELPALDVETILSYLRAFLVLYDELITSHNIDATRRLSGYIKPFDKRYTMLVLNEHYNPNLDQFVEDYLKANPTRNRPLDLLPLLCFLREERIRQRLPVEKISPRPAFHYRLPNCSVDESDWSISREWAVWMKVEALAGDHNQLKRRCRYRSKRLQGRLLFWLRRIWRTKPLLSDKPMIAVTGPDKGGYPAWFCNWLAVKRAGGFPVRMIPSMLRDNPSLPPFDGLILSGGADVAPRSYSRGLRKLVQANSPGKRVSRIRRLLTRLLAPVLFLWRGLFSLPENRTDPERDHLEHICLARALRENIPVLGICRGAQIINLHFDGALADGAGGFDGEVPHPAALLPGTPVEVKEKTYLSAILGVSRLRINSLNNRTLTQLGKGLRYTARDLKKVVQAIELEDRPHVMGVLWHPEYLPASRIHQRLFHALVQESLSRKH